MNQLGSKLYYSVILIYQQRIEKLRICLTISGGGSSRWCNPVFFLPQKSPVVIQDREDIAKPILTTALGL